MPSISSFATIILPVTKPSRADEELTYKIREAAKFFDIKVVDHIIVSDDGYFSFADSGMM